VAKTFYHGCLAPTTCSLTFFAVIHQMLVTLGFQPMAVYGRYYASSIISKEKE
jgi:hypothetical protein